MQAIKAADVSPEARAKRESAPIESSAPVSSPSENAKTIQSSTKKPGGDSIHLEAVGGAAGAPGPVVQLPQGCGAGLFTHLDTDKDGQLSGTWIEDGVKRLSGEEVKDGEQEDASVLDNLVGAFVANAGNGNVGMDMFKKIMQAWWSDQARTGHLSAAQHVCVTMQAYAAAKNIFDHEELCADLTICENKLFDHLDVNEDGELSEQEISDAVPELVTRLDRDPEAAEFFMGVAQTYQTVLQKVDYDVNGQIGRNEFHDACTEWGIDIPRLRVWLAYAAPPQSTPFRHR